MAEVSSAAPPPKARPYFVNAWVDVAMIGGVSILGYALLCPFRTTGYSDAPWLWMSATYLMWACNWPHFSATSYRLYRSRENVAQYPLTAIVIPVLLLAAVLVSFSSPATVAPLFVKLFLIWSPYHFSGQTLGITLLYARRTGHTVGKMERIFLWGFIFGTFLYPTARGETGIGNQPFYGIQCPTLGLPPEVADIAEVAMWSCGVGFLLLTAQRCVESRRMVPPMLLLPGITQFVWFVLGGSIPAFNVFVPFLHSLQYLLIAWAMQLKEKMDEGRVRPSVEYVFWESLRWGCINFFGGVALFWVLPRVGSAFGSDLSFAEPVVIAAVQIHHFFVDGVIWKLRNPKVSSPLLVHLEELIHQAPGAVEQPA